MLAGFREYCQHLSPYLYLTANTQIPQTIDSTNPCLYAIKATFRSGNIVANQIRNDA